MSAVLQKSFATQPLHILKIFLQFYHCFVDSISLFALYVHCTLNGRLLAIFFLYKIKKETTIRATIAIHSFGSFASTFFYKSKAREFLHNNFRNHVGIKITKKKRSHSRGSYWFSFLQVFTMTIYLFRKLMVVWLGISLRLLGFALEFCYTALYTLYTYYCLIVIL